MRFEVLSLMVFGTLTGCAPFVDVMVISRVPPSERAAASNIKIYKVGDNPQANISYLGPVEATSCKHQTWDAPPSQANATEQLKVKAMRTGANVITDYSCNNSGTDAWGTNCWSSVTCAGTAGLSKGGNSQ